ncbi:hypothetical protein [Namhaeicola litoreus]|uniref:Uncharacterized protein n=1 Tax=Namhaeicola litoreus TaxID=1052145 RepID=A0ABW3Y4K7_9FLAO
MNDSRQQYNDFYRQLEKEQEISMFQNMLEIEVDRILNLNYSPIKMQKELDQFKETRRMLMMESIKTQKHWFEMIQDCLDKCEDEDSIDVYLSNVYKFRTPKFFSENKFYENCIVHTNDSFPNTDDHKLQLIAKVANDNLNYISKSIEIKLDTEKLDLLYNRLNIYFENINYKNQFDNDLTRVLKGQWLKKPLLFNTNQSILVDFFKRLKENQYILEDNMTDVRDWLVNNFSFKNDKGKIVAFNKETCYDYLRGKKILPLNKELFPDIEWLHQNKKVK